jgi:hypothetical protein
LARPLLALTCLIAALAPAAARGEGSIAFNGTSSPSGGSSKLENPDADVLDGSNLMTICVWVFRTGPGQGDAGTLLTLDEAGALGSSVKLLNSASKLALFAGFVPTPGVWSVPLEDNSWSAVAVTYDKSDQGKKPTFRVNFKDVTPTEDLAPGGTPFSVPPGYCIGNLTTQTSTWQGRIAQVQVFNRILSPAEMDGSLRDPGSVTNGLRLWLPMTTATEINDRSGNGFHGTGTDLETDFNGPRLTDQPDVPPGYTDVTQQVIPRFANGITYPAGQLRGSGPHSVIVATDRTQNLAALTRSIIITEGYTEPLSEWQAGSIPPPPPDPPFAPAVLQPQLLNCTIAGYSNDGYATDGYVNDNPATVPADVEDLYDAYRAFGNAGIVDNVCFFYIPGTSLDIGRPGNKRNGPTLPHDRLKWILSRVSVRRVFRGIYNHAVDSYMRDIEVEGFRDYAVRLASSVQFQNIHTYGGGRSDEKFGSGGAGVWINGEKNIGSALYVEHSPIGLRIDGNNNTISGITSHSCATNNIRLDGANIINGFELRSSPTNILLNQAQNTISDGVIVLQDDGTGIKVTNGDVQVIRGVQIAGYQADLQPDDPSDPTFADRATGFDADDTLNDCWIQLDISNCTTGIDLDDSGTGRIGERNFIWINTHNCTTAYDLPAGWQFTTPAITTNRVFINGIQFYPAP